MSKEKQIEEMAVTMVDSDNIEVTNAFSMLFVKVAEALYNAGYRKQRTAQWVTSAEIEEGVTLSYTHRCTDCNYFYKTVCPRGDDYCHKCGAKMKGGAE